MTAHTISQGISQRLPQVEEFCRRWKIAMLASAPARHEDSDLGVFVRFDADADWNLTDRLRMQTELAQISGRPVRFVPRPAIRNRYSLSVVYNA